MEKYTVKPDNLPSVSSDAGGIHPRCSCLGAVIWKLYQLSSVTSYVDFDQFYWSVKKLCADLQIYRLGYDVD
ncbi:Hypothetical protein CINCED_3A013306 [Cinara cedri]|uniref:Uncharacterized protein n=1 Tax=Cinara cedri TaxID=506608 RepID=A0A5E4MQM9_9HEMI|nr:Hypothetical protein CINCED_3A013306 [Cinara cedri]